MQLLKHNLTTYLCALLTCEENYYWNYIHIYICSTAICHSRIIFSLSLCSYEVISYGSSLNTHL